MPFLFGVVIIILAVIGYKKINISLILFGGVLLTIFLEYTTGGLIIIALLLLQSDDELNILPLDQVGNL